MFRLRTFRKSARRSFTISPFQISFTAKSQYLSPFDVPKWKCDLRRIRDVLKRRTESKLLISDGRKRTNQIFDSVVWHTVYCLAYNEENFVRGSIQIVCVLSYVSVYKTHAQFKDSLFFVQHFIVEIAHMHTLSCIVCITTIVRASTLHTRPHTYTPLAWYRLYYQNNKRWYKHIVPQFGNWNRDEAKREDE